VRFEADHIIRQEELTRYRQFTAADSTRAFQLLFALLGAFWGYYEVYDFFAVEKEWMYYVSAAIGMLLFYAVIVILLYFTAALQSRRAVDMGKFRAYRQCIAIDHEGVHVTVEGEKTRHFAFTDIQRVRETASDFYIYQSKDMAFVVPKCQMGDYEAVSAQLREVLRTLLPETKLKIFK